MIFTETELSGAFVIDVEPFEDERGSFARTWCRDEFSKRGLMTDPVQTSTSFSPRRGTLRGLHYQVPPFAEAKLIRCTRGSIYDVIVDLRPGSPTFGVAVALVLSAQNRRMAYVPEAMAHGFLTLENDTEVFYQMSRPYSPQDARGVRWDDPQLGIAWPTAVQVISDRDRDLPSLADVSSWDSYRPVRGEIEPGIGEALHAFVAELFPIGTSLTGQGLRATLGRITRRIPLTLHEVASGTQVFDWTVPKEWNIRRGVLRGPDGETVADSARSPLEVVGYSTPVRMSLPLHELVPHLHSLAEQPDRIPYRTSYYREDWGFCLPQQVLAALPDGEYDVDIDATLEDGHLTYGEVLLPGRQQDEVLISTHCCHPSMANDNLSGVAVATFLAYHLAGRQTRYSYRFLFAPGTIGAIAWLARNHRRLDRIRHGLVLACLGDQGPISYKRTRVGDSQVDRAAAHVLRHSRMPFRLMDFSPIGYDERQFNSPGLALPVGSLTRSQPGEYSEYHTSADDLGLVTPEALAHSYRVLLDVVDVLEGNQRYRNLKPECEPQLGRRGLYPPLGGPTPDEERRALLWVLSGSDGDHDLLDIADRSELAFPRILAAAETLLQAGLLAPIGSGIQNADIGASS
jgi:dTDP-4-dehydrorhamnose 3,5-epimerase